MRKERKQKIYEGIMSLAETVSYTLGPKGRNIAIWNKFNGEDPFVTKDGVTVAENYNSSDEEQDLGCQLIKEVASKTNDSAGDGTTTATVLANVMIFEGIKNVTAGLSPIDLKRGMDMATKKAVDMLNAMTEEVDIDSDKLNSVACISANNDKELGILIADAFKSAGKNGVVTVEESNEAESYSKLVKGMQINRGYKSDLFANSPDEITCEFDDPMYFLYNGKLTTQNQIIPIIEFVKSKGRPIVIIAEDIDDEALNQLLLNKMHGIIKCVAVKAPGFSSSRPEYLRDISFLTQSVIFDDGTKFYDIEDVEFTEEMFGGSERISVNKTDTTIVGGYGVDIVQDRINRLKQDLKKATKTTDKEQIKSRIAKLSGGVGVVYVGGHTPAERKERLHRAIDAVKAVNAAIEEGIVPGGGLALLRIAEKLPTYSDIKYNTLSLEKDIKIRRGEEIGYQIVVDSLYSPTMIIAENAGANGDVVVEKIKEHIETVGYDAYNDDYVEMMESGIIDPKKVTRVALENANSLAGMVLLIEDSIIN